MNKIPFFLIALFLMTGCATIFTGTKDRIAFTSTPSGATIYKDGVEICTTPCNYKVKRSLNDTEVEFKLDGYETRLITLDKELNLVSIINLGNLFGWGIDALSGAVMKYDRKAYDLKLTKESSASLVQPTRIDIDTKSNTVTLTVQE
ncbi:MAG: PEGA domain-containing protein [Algoriphagus sp.]|nr:PEGA domain-containing protein [Algoriphagus sp.]